MKLTVEDAEVVLGGALRVPGQSVVIHKAGPQAVIGIDGATGVWDDLVKVYWQGAHVRDLENVDQVEIRDQAGRVVEALPVITERKAYELDGETVFFLREAE
jgi:predicted ThiF/HesA family dinucleotide-utilizing enzyme